MIVNNNPDQKYSKASIWIHWISAVLIIFLFPFGKYLEDLDHIDKLFPLKLHAILGSIVLLLSIYRVYLLFKEPRPDHLDTGSKLNNKLIKVIHNAFYILLFLISFTGIATMITTGYGDFLTTGDVNLIKPHDDSVVLELHEIFASLTMLLLIFHVVGIIKHKLLTNENVLKRMI